MTAETQRHDYEPGNDPSPMQTDPPCRMCGKPKRDRVHTEEGK